MTSNPALRFAFSGLLAIGILASLPAVAGAQAQAKPPARPKFNGPKWEFEVHGALATPYSAPSGLSNAPGEGPSFTLGDGTTSTRAVPSWMFGRGTAFLNQVLALRGVPERLTALDEKGWPAAGRRAGAQFGARLGRRVTEALWIQISGDFGLDPIGFDGEGNSQIEETRADFVRTFTALNNSTLTLTPNPTITSMATVHSGGHRVIASGVVEYRAKGSGLKPYMLAGAGFATPVGGNTSLDLSSRYQLATPSGTKFDETDTVVLEYRTAASFVAIAGFGFMRDLSPRSGYRVETRVVIGRENLDVRLNTAPTVTVTTPTGAAILNSTNPGLQFATNGLRTNLSAPAIHDFAALSATGQRIQWVISAGYFRRF